MGNYGGAVGTAVESVVDFGQIAASVFPGGESVMELRQGGLKVAEDAVQPFAGRNVTEALPFGGMTMLWVNPV